MSAIQVQRRCLPSCCCKVRIPSVSWLRGVPILRKSNLHAAQVGCHQAVDGGELWRHSRGSAPRLQASDTAIQGRRTLAAMKEHSSSVPQAEKYVGSELVEVRHKLSGLRHPQSSLESS